MKIEKIATRFLLAFVLISIGYALGRDAGFRAASRLTDKGINSAASPDATAPRKVAVTYFHSHFRCVTCNTIERLAKETVETRFAGDLDTHRVEWRTANFQEQPALASQYGIVSACVVVTVEEGGQIVAFDRLDEFWELVDDPPAFASYVGDAIQKRLDEVKPS